MQQVTVDGARWQQDSEGTWLALRVKSQQTAMDVCDALKPGKEYNVTIKGKGRSLDANSMCWQICTDIANVIGTTKEAVYKYAIREVGVYTPLPIKAEAVDAFSRIWANHGIGWFLDVIDESKLPGYKLCFAYAGSSTYDTSEMSRLIDNLVFSAKEIGIQVLSERERSLLIEKWDR